MDYTIGGYIYLTISLFAILISGPIRDANCTCYFPIEYQGTFMMQTQQSQPQTLALTTMPPVRSSSLSRSGSGSGSGSTVGRWPVTSSPSFGSLEVSFGEVTYSEITIEADGIPPWGSCHKREGSHVILKDTNGAVDCMRCFHLEMKSSNVLEIHAEGLARCYTNEEAARATCPTKREVKENRSTTEYILFRKQIPDETIETIEKIFCPFNGRFKFTYTSNHGHTHCTSIASELSNCPKGNVLSARFRKCSSIPNQEIQFQCLGDWDSGNGYGDRYIALMDVSNETKNRPKYRCGLYRENVTTGQIFVSLSADSTCSTNLINARVGYETLTLTPNVNRGSSSSFEMVKCRFPDWTQGKWNGAKIDGNQFKFKDVVNSYRTLTSKCLMKHPSPINDRFIVHSTTQCGESFYSCVWMKRRSTNILEFQFGSKSSGNLLGHLCDDQQFGSNQWNTLGRKVVSIETPCPITGDYSGIVPGVSGLCAKVSSDCTNPDMMFHSVSSCENQTHVFEERKYRCLGNWEEDGILYTFTQRRDTTGYQCFAGKILGNGEVAYIREAGENCIRGDDPLTSGMKISKQAACPRIMEITTTPSPTTTSSSGSSPASLRPRIDKVRPVYKPPSFPPTVRTLPTKPPIQLHHIPRPAPSMLGSGENYRHWYQSDQSEKKIFNPASITPFKHTKVRRNSGLLTMPMDWLIFPLIFVAHLIADNLIHRNLVG